MSRFDLFYESRVLLLNPFGLAYRYNISINRKGYTALKAYISERVLLLAEYIIENQTTVRKAAKEFNISKSTVHKDISERLLSVNRELAQEVQKVLQANKAERHIRGGLATKHKYELQKQNEQKQVMSGMW